MISCTWPLPRSTFRRRRGTSRTTPEEHGAVFGRPKHQIGQFAPRRRANFQKPLFHPKWPPGAPREPPQGPRGRPRDGPGASQARPGRSQSTFVPKIVPKWSRIDEKWNLPWIFEIATNFHHFLHGFWKFFRGVFRCVFRPCVFEKVPLLQSATCQDTMVFTMDSNDFNVLHFSGQGQ